MIRAAIVIHSVIVRHGLRSVLEDRGDILVVSENAAFEQFRASTQGIDVLIVDNEEVIKLLHFPSAEWENEQGYSVLVLGEDLDQEVQKLFLREGRSWGLLPTDSSAEAITAALTAVYEGLVVVQPEFLNFQNIVKIRAKSEHVLVEELTGRELEILQLLANGLSNKHIAAKLSISEHTVKFHVSSIFSKLDVTSRTEAVRMGFRLGLVAL